MEHFLVELGRSLCILYNWIHICDVLKASHAAFLCFGLVAIWEPFLTWQILVFMLQSHPLLNTHRYGSSTYIHTQLTPSNCCKGGFYTKSGWRQLVKVETKNICSSGSWLSFIEGIEVYTKMFWWLQIYETGSGNDHSWSKRWSINFYVLVITPIRSIIAMIYAYSLC